MIPRYTKKEMETIWSDAYKFRLFFLIEAALCDALAEKKLIPQEDADQIRSRGDKPYDDQRIARIHAIENETKHDVIAFLTELAEWVGESSRFVHQGLTSSDILDTTFSLQLRDAADLIILDLEKLLQALKEKAQLYRYTPMIGRTHGIHAEPTTFGLKMTRFYAEFKRSYNRLKRARDEISSCALSGPVGTFSSISPEIEKIVAEKLNLFPEPISSQIIPRDRHAYFFSVLAIIAGSIENIATEIRHMQRTEVMEVAENFSQKQKGSSAMPHKRNPILSENITGLARLIRSYALPALENITTWHERDISHSSVERVIAPDATIALNFALSRLTNIITHLQVFPENMLKNMESLQGVHQSQKILLALTHKGISREEAYKIVQQASHQALDEKRPLRYTINENKVFTQLFSEQEVENLFSPSQYNSKENIDHIFQSVFGSL